MEQKLVCEISTSAASILLEHEIRAQVEGRACILSNSVQQCLNVTAKTVGMFLYPFLNTVCAGEFHRQTCNADPLFAVIQATTLEGFMQLLAAVLCVTRACLQHCSKMRSVLEEGLRAGRTPRTQWAPLLDQMQEAAQAISEVASGRWAKLLGSRYILLLVNSDGLLHQQPY